MFLFEHLLSGCLFYVGHVLSYWRETCSHVLRTVQLVFVLKDKCVVVKDEKILAKKRFLPLPVPFLPASCPSIPRRLPCPVTDRCISSVPGAQSP